MSGSLARMRWNIPYQRNPFFTGREDILSRLDRALHAEQRVALSQPQGISGLGGIGKTQTVVEYAYRHREKYGAVLWVRADSVTSLISSMVELAQVLRLPERNEQDQEIIVQAVLRWLRLHSDWLLIYDNIDDLSLAERFLPKAGAGHLLFTTRAHALGGLAQRLDIQQMDPEIGALLLLRRASLLALQATLNVANPDDRRTALAISEELDGLPLALDQAGAYIKETPYPLPDYLALYQTRRTDILRIRGSFDQDYPASVATTWSLSFERVSHINPAAADLLHFCAFLAPNAIPEALLTAGGSYLGAVLAPVVANPLLFDQACGEGLRFSLLERRADESTLTVHRLVQTVLRDSISVEAAKQWKQLAILAIYTACPNIEDIERWEAWELWLPHALTCVTWIEQEQLCDEASGDILNDAGYYLVEHGRYREAEPLLDRAISIYEQCLGATHPSTALCINNLGMLYYEQGKHAETESYLQRALTDLEQQLGVEHLTTASILNNIAFLYHEQYKYTEAESLYQRVLAIREQQLGPDHPKTILVLNNLANLYQEQGRNAEAESHFRRVLAILEQQSGPEHYHIATALHNLAGLYKEQGEYAKAEPLYQRALAILEQQLGPEHPKTVVTFHNLANLYYHQGKYVQAESLYRRELWVQELMWGPEHLQVTSPIYGLASLYHRQGNYAQAEPFYQRALAIREQQLESNHPKVASSLFGLGTLYHDQGKDAEAESLYQRALTIWEHQLGPEHFSLGPILNNLATLYHRQSKYAQAEPLYQRALHIAYQQMGPGHPRTIVTRENYAHLLRAMGRDREAKKLEERL